MTFQKMTNDIIDYRLGVITLVQLSERRPTWRVDDATAKFCIEQATSAGRVK